jgi:hypothetical protein
LLVHMLQTLSASPISYRRTHVRCLIDWWLNSFCKKGGLRLIFPSPSSPSYQATSRDPEASYAARTARNYFAESGNSFLPGRAHLPETRRPPLRQELLEIIFPSLASPSYQAVLNFQRQTARPAPLTPRMQLTILQGLCAVLLKMIEFCPK